MTIDFSHYSRFTPASQATRADVACDFLPDGVMEPVVTEVSAALANADKSPDNYYLGHPGDAATWRKYPMSFEVSKALVRSLCEDMGPVFLECCDDGFEVLQVAQFDPYSGSSSVCSADAVRLEKNDTVHDAVILAHEFGHWLSFNAGTEKVTKTAFSVAEIPAFFLQEMAYDKLKTTNLWPDADSYLQYQFKTRPELMPHGATIVAQLNGIEPMPDADPLAKRMVERLQNNSAALLDFTYRNLHGHPMGVILGTELYQLYKNTASERKTQMLDTLYRSGDALTIEKICDAFDVTSKTQLAEMTKKYCTAAFAPIGPRLPLAQPFQPPG